MQQHGQELALVSRGDDGVQRRLLRRGEQELQLARLHSGNMESSQLLR